MKTKCTYLIVGGGITGLTFANYVKGEDYLILESDKQLGGYCKTIYQDGFTWDYAGHFFHFQTNEIKNLFEGKINEADLISKKKNTVIFHNDIIVDFPFQLNIHQLDKEEFIECLSDLYFKSDAGKHDNFLEMLYSKFGRAITEKFLRPYNEKLYACDLESLDPDAMGRFFPHVALSDVLGNMAGERYSNSYNDTFLYPKEGAMQFVNALAEGVNFKKVWLSEAVVGLDKRARTVRTSNGREINYEFLINTSPLNKFINFSTKSEIELSLEKTLTCNKVLVFNLGFNKKSTFTDLHWAYFSSSSINFYRVGFYDNILDETRLSLYVEIGYAENETPDIEQELNTTLLNLIQVGIIDNTHQLISHAALIMDPAYVHVTQQMLNQKKHYKEILKSQGIYTIGRYGDWKYCSIEDSMLDAMYTANILNSR